MSAYVKCHKCHKCGEAMYYSGGCLGEYECWNDRCKKIHATREEEALNDTKSTHVSCNNAGGQFGTSRCSCWRCRPETR